jgi:hypothetical protein
MLALFTLSDDVVSLMPKTIVAHFDCLIQLFAYIAYHILCTQTTESFGINDTTYAKYKMNTKQCASAGLGLAFSISCTSESQTTFQCGINTIEKNANRQKLKAFENLRLP